jgi:hypothetical protein
MDVEPLIAFFVDVSCAEEDDSSFVCQVYMVIDGVAYFSGALQAASAEATLS